MQMRKLVCWGAGQLIDSCELMESSEWRRFSAFPTTTSHNMVASVLKKASSFTELAFYDFTDSFNHRVASM